MQAANDDIEAQAARIGDAEAALRRAAEGGDTAARLQLGVGLARIGRSEEGRPWIEAAAESGAPVALREAGIWKLTGLGGPVDRAGGAMAIREAAAAGDATSLLHAAALDVAYDVEDPDWAGAAASLVAAAKAGEPRALVATAELLGPGDAARPPRRALLERAAMAGLPAAMHALAASLLDEPDGNERAGLRWLANAANGGSTLALLRVAARGGLGPTGTPTTMFRRVAVDWDGLPARFDWPHARPLPAAETPRESQPIRVFRALLSKAECDAVAGAGAPLLVPTGPGPDVTPFGPVESNAFVQSLDARLLAAMGEGRAGADPALLIRHLAGRPGARFDDANPTPRGRPRTYGLVRLSDSSVGGPVAFRGLDLTLDLEAGDAVVWSALDAAGGQDATRIAEDMSPAAGAKFSLMKLVRGG